MLEDLPGSKGKITLLLFVARDGSQFATAWLLSRIRAKESPWAGLPVLVSIVSFSSFCGLRF